MNAQGNEQAPDNKVGGSSPLRADAPAWEPTTAVVVADWVAGLPSTSDNPSVLTQQKLREIFLGQ